MAGSLGSLVISLEANIAKFTDAMEQSVYIAERNAKRTARAFDQVTRSIQSLAAMAGVGLSFNALWASFKEVTSEEANLSRWSMRLNTTAQDLSSFGVMIRRTGMDADSFYLALERMNRNISNAELKVDAASGAVDEFGQPLVQGARLMDELGLKAEVLNNLPLPEKLMAISEAMQANIAPADQSRIALELAGRGGGALVTALKGGPEAMQAWIDKQTELGLITNEMAQRGKEAKIAAGDLATAWHHFAVELTDMVAPAITGTLNLLTELAKAARSGPPIMAYMPETAMAYAIKQADQNQGFAGHGTTGSWIPQEVFKPPVRPGPKTSGGGAGSADKNLSGLMNIIDGLEKEYAKFTQGAEAESDAWYAHMVNRIKGVQEVMDDPQTAQAQALALASQVLIERKKKQEEDYQGWLAASYYDNEAKINNERQQKLRQYLGNAQKQEENNAVFDLKLAEERSKKESDLQNMTKGYYSTLAGLSPLLVAQLAYKQQALDLEMRINQAGLEREIIQKSIPGAQADELRGLLFLTNQAKQYALEKEKWAGQGVSGGLKIWAADRQSQMDTRGSQAAIDFMKSAETWVGDTGAQAFIDHLHGKKTDLAQMFSNLGDAFIKKSFQMGTQSIFDSIAGAVGLPAGLGKPTGSAVNPFYVVPIGGGLGDLLGSKNSFNGLFGKKLNSFGRENDFSDLFGGSTEGGAADMAATLNNVFASADQDLSQVSANFGDTFNGAVNGLSGVSNGFGGIFDGAISGFESLFSGIGNLFSGGDMGGGGGIIGLITSFFGLFAAHGAVFNSGRVVPYARGGVVHRPTVFPMAGGLGLMGEAGPEAVLPLTRIGGDLGVKTTGGGGGAQVNVIVNNNAAGTQARQETTPQGDIVITVEQIMSRVAARPGPFLNTLKAQGVQFSPAARRGY